MSKYSRTPLILKAKEALGEASLQKQDKQDKERQEAQRWEEKALKRQLHKCFEQQHRRPTIWEKLPEFKVKLVPVVLATVAITAAYWVPDLPTESYLLYYHNNSTQGVYDYLHFTDKQTKAWRDQ